MKNNKGITLIALVVTIIVLLILAGVSIAMLTGQNGILNRGQSAAIESAVTDAKEQISLSVAEAITNWNSVKYGGVAASSVTPVIVETEGSADTMDTYILKCLKETKKAIEKSGNVTVEGITEATTTAPVATFSVQSKKNPSVKRTATWAANGSISWDK